MQPLNDCGGHRHQRRSLEPKRRPGCLDTARTRLQAPTGIHMSQMTRFASTRWLAAGALRRICRLLVAHQRLGDRQHARRNSLTCSSPPRQCGSTRTPTPRARRLRLGQIHAEDPRDRRPGAPSRTAPWARSPTTCASPREPITRSCCSRSTRLGALTASAHGCRREQQPGSRLRRTPPAPPTGRR